MEMKDRSAEELLSWARERLETITPLRTDCGRVCGRRCCRTLEGEETGMLLFPGEEDFYEDLEGWRILPAGPELLLICPGTCDRRDRPLACRLFPLLPCLREDGSAVPATDERSRAVCPLSRQGKRGMDPAFVEAVREVGERLSRDPAQRAFLRRRTEEQAELRELRKKLRG